MFFLSKLLGQTVRDMADKPVGTLHDLVVSPKRTYPHVTALAHQAARQARAGALVERRQLRGVGLAAARGGRRS